MVASRSGSGWVWALVSAAGVAAGAAGAGTGMVPAGSSARAIIVSVWAPELPYTLREPSMSRATVYRSPLMKPVECIRVRFSRQHIQPCLTFQLEATDGRPKYWLNPSAAVARVLAIAESSHGATAGSPATAT